MCFVFIWEKTATCATYSINWLVFITEMKSVYSAVRTGSLNNNCTLCPYCIYVFCIYLRKNSDLCHLQHKLIGFYSRDEKSLKLLTTKCTYITFTSNTLKHLKPIWHISSVSDHHQGVSSFLAKVNTYSRFSPVL